MSTVLAAPHPRLGFLLVTGAAFAWSTAGFFARLIALDSWSMLVWRGLFGAAGILVFIIARERGGTIASFRNLGWPGFAFVILCTIGMTSFLLALDYTSVAHVAIIYATVPFCAAGLAWFAMGERPSRSAVAASLAALGGVGIMVGLGTEGSMTGNIMAFVMTLAMAGMIVLARRFPEIPTLPATCLAALGTGIISLPFAAHIIVSAHDMALLALFGLVNSALGIVLFMTGSRLLPAIESALISSLDAPLAPLWVWLAFGETPTKATLAGGAVVFIAVLAHVLNSQNAPPQMARQG